MKERQIIFKPDMVKAILEGRKTQTRRVIKLNKLPKIQEINHRPYLDSFEIITEKCRYHLPLNEVLKRCPCGLVGDRLWVKENYAFPHKYDGHRPRYVPNDTKVYYPASEDIGGLILRPSIFMPRWASRITLEITSVRVERVQDISDQDAISEGLKPITKDGNIFKYGIPDRDGFPGGSDIGWAWQNWKNSPKAAYKRLWELINGAGSWDLNPWVWVIEFKMVE
jgi:hypothetical protein